MSADDIARKLGEAEVRIRGGALVGVERAAEHVLGESHKVVPIEEGTLGRSGRVVAGIVNGDPVATMSYNTPYAARQHEDLRYRHDKGRTAKYLERPLVAERDAVLKIIGQAIKEMLS